VGTKRSERASKTSASSAPKKTAASKAKPAEAKSSEVKAVRAKTAGRTKDADPAADETSSPTATSPTPRSGAKAAKGSVEKRKEASPARGKAATTSGRGAKLERAGAEHDDDLDAEDTDDLEEPALPARAAAGKNGKAAKAKVDDADADLSDSEDEDSDWGEPSFPAARARGEEGKAGKKAKAGSEKRASASSADDDGDGDGEIDDDYGSEDAELDDAGFDESGIDPLVAEVSGGAEGGRTGRDANGRRGGRGDDGDVDALISLGKSKGFLTYDEVNDALPDDDVGADQMDRVLSRLDTEDIEVVSARVEADVPPRAVVGDSEPPPSSTRKGGAAKRGEMNDAAYGRSNDPVRMYLRKMGSVALLTREREVEIAKRIEEGENEVLDAILGSPLATRENTGVQHRHVAELSTALAELGHEVRVYTRRDDPHLPALVRMSDGSLRGYKVPCGQAPTPSTPYTKLGTGWNAYNAPRPAT